MASTPPASRPQDHLHRLPDELLVMICSHNVPSTGASKKEIRQYLLSQSLSKRFRGCANDAFKEVFTLEADLDIHCRDNLRDRWHLPFFSPDYLYENASFMVLVQKVALHVKCLHHRFFREGVEETMRMMRKLNQETSLRKIMITVDSHEEDFAQDIANFVYAEISEEFPRLEFFGYDDYADEDDPWELTLFGQPIDLGGHSTFGLFAEAEEDVLRPTWKIDIWKPTEAIRLGRDCPWNENSEKKCTHCENKWWWSRKERTWKIILDDDEDGTAEVAVEK